MGVALGSGPHVYEMVDGWGMLPEGWVFRDVADVAVDSRDNVYVFNRGGHPMIVFDSGGRLLRTWGEGLFPSPHGVTLGPDGSVWCVDSGEHTIRQCTPDGRVLMTIGEPGRAAPPFSGRPFNQPTQVAFSPAGEIYVADGYRNACIHKYAPDGRYLFSWGTPGTGSGELNVPHNIGVDEQGFVYVADRENHRIQVFDGQGRFEALWAVFHRINGLCLDLGPGRTGLAYVAEMGSFLAVNRDTPNIGPRVSIADMQGKVLARLGDQPEADGPGRFITPHGIAVDSRGDIYVGESRFARLGRVENDFRCLRKLVRRPV